MSSFLDLSRLRSCSLFAVFVVSGRRVLIVHPNMGVAGGVPVVMWGIAQ